jgi:hypothetical protein
MTAMAVVKRFPGIGMMGVPDFWVFFQCVGNYKNLS